MRTWVVRTGGDTWQVLRHKHISQSTCAIDGLWCGLVGSSDWPKVFTGIISPGGGAGRTQMLSVEEVTWNNKKLHSMDDNECFLWHYSTKIELSGTAFHKMSRSHVRWQCRFQAHNSSFKIYSAAVETLNLIWRNYTLSKQTLKLMLNLSMHVRVLGTSLSLALYPGGVI